MGQAGNEGIPELLGGDLVGLLDPAAAARHHGCVRRRRRRHRRRHRGRGDRRRCSTRSRRTRTASASRSSSTGPTGPCASARGCASWPRTRPWRWCGSRRSSHQYPLNDKLYYPVYATCAELGLPVSVNVGIPGPRVRSACQHPELLEDVLIDFKGLTVIGAHMGHPYEALLMQYMLKWPDLYLSNSAYLAKYMDPALVSFMDSYARHGPRPLRLGPSLPARWSGRWPPPGTCPSPTRRPRPSSAGRPPGCLHLD